jgi:hypothetical protein
VVRGDLARRALPPHRAGRLLPLGAPAGLSERAATVAGVAYGFLRTNLIFLHRVGAAAVAPSCFGRAPLFSSPTARNVDHSRAHAHLVVVRRLPAAFVFNSTRSSRCTCG